MESIDRLNRAIHYIEENLQNGVDYKEISKITLSPISAFQRFFALTTGIALSEYIRRRKLSNAAGDLAQTSLKVIDVAIKYGYESVDAFSVAFKRAYGISPSVARQNKIRIEPFHRMHYTLSIHYLKGETKMKRITHNRRLCNGDQGHNFELVDCIRFILECKGMGDKPDFWEIAALTGDGVAQVYSRNPATGCEYCVSGYLTGPEHIGYIFNTLGYAHEYVTAAQLGADKAKYAKKIMDSIDNNIPVLVKTNLHDIHGWTSDVGTHCLITGYDHSGQIIKLLVAAHDETIDVILTGNNKIDLVFIGERQREVALEELYEEAAGKTLHWLTLPERDGVFFGAAAYRAWADDIEAGRFEDNDLPLWENYGIFICNLATNGSWIFGTFKKLAESNSSYARLMPQSGKIHDLLCPEWSPEGGKNLWTQLEELDAGMDMDKVKITMRDKEKRSKVAATLRNFAERLDKAIEIMRISELSCPK